MMDLSYSDDFGKTVKVLQAGGNKFLLAHNFFFVAQVHGWFDVVWSHK